MNLDFFRRPAIVGFILLACLTLLAPVVAAQKIGHQPVLSPASQPYLTTTDPTTDFNLIHVDGGIIDADLNIWRAGFGLSPAMTAQGTAEATARAWVDEFGQSYGIGNSAHLSLHRETGAHGVQHVTFAQMWNDIPVYERYVHVNLGLNGLPTMVSSGYAPHVEDIDHVSTQPQIGEAQARSVAGAAIADGSYEVHSTSLQLYPESSPRLIWSVEVSPAPGVGTWRVLVDAQTGELVNVLDRVKYRHAHRKVIARRSVRSDTTGRGLIWDPDPLTMAGATYGAPYADIGDLNNEQLAAQLIEVDLPGITLGPDTLYRLIGPYVKISATPIRYSPPAVAHPDSFMFQRDNDHFEAVMTYYHIHSSQVHLQSLDIGRPIAADTIIVKPNGLTEDNSYFDPGKFELGFGSGGVDDGEDVEVILHEYGHALLHSSTGIDIGLDEEGAAYHEGFADYWALSHTRNLIELGIVPNRDWRQIFDWDAGIDASGYGAFWPGRYVESNLTYDDATCTDILSPCDIYFDGDILANVLMRLWETLGRSVTDRLVSFSHGYLGLPFTMESAVQALVQADIDLNEGDNVATINRYFRDAAYPTRIEYEPGDADPPLLHPNYPNPFSSVTNVTFSLKSTTQVRVEVFNVLGQRVRIVRDAVESVGTHTQAVDLSDHPTGIYFLRVTASGRQQSQPILLVR